MVKGSLLWHYKCYTWVSTSLIAKLWIWQFMKIWHCEFLVEKSHLAKWEWFKISKLLQITENQLYGFRKYGFERNVAFERNGLLILRLHVRGHKSHIAEKRSPLNCPPLSLPQPICGVKSSITKIPGKELLQSIRNLKFGIPQGWTEFLFQSFHKLFKLLCTNLRKEEIEILSTSIS